MQPTLFRRVLAALAVGSLIGGLMWLAWRTIPSPVHPIRVATMEWPGFYSIMRADVEGCFTSIPATLIIKPDNASLIELFSRR